MHFKFEQENQKMEKRIEIVSPNFAAALGDDASSPNCSRRTQKTITHTPGMPEREQNIDIYIHMYVYSR